MKILLTIIFLSLLSSSCSTPSEDLVVRDGLYYKKFSEVPFSGKVTGLRNGSIKNGKAEGEWVVYDWDGILNEETTGTYKNGVKISDRKTNHLINYENTTNHTLFITSIVSKLE